MNIGGIQDFGSSVFLRSNWNWNSSNNWHFVEHWSWNWDWSGDWDSSYDWILNVVDFSLVDILLHDWLGDDLLGWGLNSLYSLLSVVFGGLCDRVLFDCLILSSVELDFDVFSLDHWLDVSLVDDLSSWSGNILGSAGISDLSLSGNRISVDHLSLRRNEIDFLGIVDNSSFDDWLGEDFLGRGLEVSVDGFSVEFGWSGNDWIVDISGLSSLDIESLSNSLYSWLNKLFSDSNISGYLYWNTSLNGSLIYNGIFGLSFSIDWSRNDFLSNNRSLNNSLSDDRLGDNLLGNDWLLDDFSGHYWLADYLLGLSDDWFRVEDLGGQVLLLYGLSGDFSGSNDLPSAGGGFSLESGRAVEGKRPSVQLNLL